MSLPISTENQQAHILRESVAPVLAEGLVCALRDQPADAAAYMAEFLAASGAGTAQAVLDQRKFGQECARLDAELASLTEQLEVARTERARRLPDTSDAHAQREAAVAAASWSELRRLKRLTRSVKVKMSEPLSASDWPIPEGIILVQGANGLDTGPLCDQLQKDFRVRHVDAILARQNGTQPGHGQPGGSVDVLQEVSEALLARPTEAVLLQGYLHPPHVLRDLLEACSARVGPPTAILLPTCDEKEHARRLMEEGAVRRVPMSWEAAGELARDWAIHESAEIEAAARDAMIPVLRVDVSGDFNSQMTALLVAITSI